LYFNYFRTLCVLPLALLAIYLIVFGRVPRGPIATQAGLTAPEWVAVGTLSLMPLCVIVLSNYTTHVFVDRYTLWALTGIAVLFAALLYAAASNTTALGVGTLSLMLVLVASREAYALWQQPVLTYSESLLQELGSLPNSSEPIVIADHGVFLQLSYYAAPRLRKRLLYPINRELDLRYFGFDTTPLIMSALSHRTQLPIIGYEAVIAAHPRFLLAAFCPILKDGQPYHYLPGHLVTAGYHVLPIGSSKSLVLFQVEAPDGKFETSPARRSEL